MCTVIVTIRTVLWYVFSLVSTLLVLVALFNKRWLENDNYLSRIGSSGETVIKDSFDSIGAAASMNEWPHHGSDGLIR